MAIQLPGLQPALHLNMKVKYMPTDSVPLALAPASSFFP